MVADMKTTRQTLVSVNMLDGPSVVINAPWQLAVILIQANVFWAV